MVGSLCVTSSFLNTFSWNVFAAWTHFQKFVGENIIETHSINQKLPPLIETVRTCALCNLTFLLSTWRKRHFGIITNSLVKLCKAFRVHFRLIYGSWGWAWRRAFEIVGPARPDFLNPGPSPARPDIFGTQARPARSAGRAGPGLGLGPGLRSLVSSNVFGGRFVIFSLKNVKNRKFEIAQFDWKTIGNCRMRIGGIYGSRTKRRRRINMTVLFLCSCYYGKKVNTSCCLPL